MWIYEQKSGRLRHSAGGVDRQVAEGYSGFQDAKNDPSAEGKPGLGPIPQGAYVVGPEEESDTHGPVAMHLLPLTGTDTHGRSGFLIHGDSREHPGGASHGCIILGRPTRELIAGSHDRLLLVLIGEVVS